MRFTRLIPGAFALASLSTLAAGCVGSARGGVYADSGYAGQPVYDDGYAESEYDTDYAPPPPRETVIYNNRPGYVWVTGRWARVGARWNWRRGYWVRQRPGLVFTQPRWNRVGGRWVYRPGGWNRNPYAGRNIDQRDRVLDRRDERLDRRQDRLDDRFDKRPRARERFEDRQQRRQRDMREDQRQRRRDQRQEKRRNENRDQRRGRDSDEDQD